MMRTTSWAQAPILDNAAKEQAASVRGVVLRGCALLFRGGVHHCCLLVLMSCCHLVVLYR